MKDGDSSRSTAWQAEAKEKNFIVTSVSHFPFQTANCHLFFPLFCMKKRCAFHSHLRIYVFIMASHSKVCGGELHLPQQEDAQYNHLSFKKRRSKRNQREANAGLSSASTRLPAQFMQRHHVPRAVIDNWLSLARHLQRKTGSLQRLGLINNHFHH